MGFVCSRSRRTLVFAAIILPCLGGAFQQQPADRDENRVTIDVTRVSLLATVTDKKGRLMNSLTQGDFEIAEAANSQHILQFRSETDLPLRMAVLIDTSNSVRDRFQFVQDAAMAFLQNTLRPGKDKAIVISFDSVVESVGSFSDDPNELARYIRELRPGRGTALYDAVDYACKRYLNLGDSHEDARRIVLIVSDGEDTQSQMPRTLCLETAHKSNAVIYTVSTGLTQPGGTGPRVLVYLADETGGRALFPLALKHMTDAFKDLSDELRSQYSIIYRPEPLVADGRFHPVTIRIKNRKDLKVRTRKGYFAPLR